jgi:hypothetical protein
MVDIAFATHPAFFQEYEGAAASPEMHLFATVLAKVGSRPGTPEKNTFKYIYICVCIPSGYLT